MTPAEWLADPYRSEFMRNALFAALLVGTVAPLVGVWIVLRRLTYLGDAMSHSLLAGVAAAYLAGTSVTAGALATGVVMAAGTAALASHPRLRPDSVIGVVETALFAVGVVMVSTRSDHIGVDLSAYLFGQITTVTSGDLVVNTVLAVIVLGVVTWLFADLRAATFDPVHARLVGIRVGALGTGLLVLLAVAIVVSLQTVGLLMSVAMLATPAAAARLLTSRTITMTGAAVAIGAIAAYLGLTASYHLDTPPGATVALTAVGALVAAFLATLPRRVHRHRSPATPAP